MIYNYTTFFIIERSNHMPSAFHIIGQILAIFLMALVFPAVLVAQEAKTRLEPGRVTANARPAAFLPAAAQPESLLLTGIAAIGTQRFVYLTNPVTSQSIELMSGAPTTNGIELVKVQDEGLVATWKVLIRQDGVERWLNFAAPSQTATAGTIAILSATSMVPTDPVADFKRPPPQNAGTMSNDTPSAALRKRPLNTFPLPSGL